MSLQSSHDSLELQLSVEQNGYGDTLALQERLEYLPFNDNFEIDPANLKLLDALGSGHFGDVRLGLLKSNDSRCIVAVKTPKSVLDKRMSRMNDDEREEEFCRQREALRDELRIMSFLPEHPNVVKLLGGITTIKNDFCVVIEYCEYGGLDSFLRQQFDDGNFVNELQQDHDWKESTVDAAKFIKMIQKRSGMHSFAEQLSARRESRRISTCDLLAFALQIARAMNFLASNMVLHRDVALRNVLLKADYTIRVADFGLSRRAGKDGSYFQSRDIMVPFRYMAPEALRSGRFSKQSELWSFGVVLWELFTLAKQQPYDDTDYRNTGAKDVHGILDFLDSGLRLCISEYTPASVGTMITALWDEDPNQRPSFRACQDILIEELAHFNPMMSLLHGINDDRQSVASIKRIAVKFNNGREEASVSNENKKLRRRLYSTIGLSVILAILCAALLSTLLIMELSKGGRDEELKQDSIDKEGNFKASNNEKYQYMLQWNTTTVKLKALRRTIMGELYHTKANNVSLSWQPSYAKSDDSRWINLRLLYPSGELQQVGVVKYAFEALNTTSTVIFHKWAGEDWLGRRKALLAQNFMPLNFDDKQFVDRIVIFRIYWTLESEAQVRSQLDKEVAAISAQSVCCSDGWTPLPNSNKCFKVESKKSSWFDANQTCTDHGGYLLSMNNQTDIQFVVSLVQISLQGNDSGYSVWVGGRTNEPRKSDTTHWFWTDGSDFEAHLWAKGEPNNSQEYCHAKEQESCLQFVLNNKKWNDNCCSLNFPFICEQIVSDWTPCK
uniref:Uncharacterized protein n=1 Tax=Plectus sambesii TaxID=2011161 RepID=A0A914WQS9_9BILA